MQRIGTTSRTGQPPIAWATPFLDQVRGVSSYAWWIIGVTVGALVMRTYQLGVPVLWRDEAFTAVAVRLPVLDMLNVVRHDSAPPLAYLLVKLANDVSSSPWSLRMVSALAGTAAIPIAAALGRRIGGERAGVLAGMAMAVMPSFVLESRDMRMYALASTLAMASALALWRAVERPSRGRLLALSGCVALAAWTQYFAVLAVAGQLLAAAVVFRPARQTMLKVTGAAAAGLITLVPWLVVAIPQFQHAGSPFWINPVNLDRLEDLFQEFVAGYSLSSSSPLATLLNNLRGVASVGAAVAVAAAVVLLFRAPRRERRRLAYTALTGVIPVVALLLFSLRRPLFDQRYANVLWGTLVPVLGAGLAWLASRRIGWTLVAASLLPVAVCAAAMGPNPAYTDVRGAVAALNRQAKPRDFVAIEGANDYYPVIYYANPGLDSRIHVISSGVQWFDGTAQYRADTWMPAIPSSVRGGVFVITESGNRSSVKVPRGYALRKRRCEQRVCLESWSR